MEIPFDVTFRTEDGREVKDVFSVRLEPDVMADGSVEVLSAWTDCTDGSQADLLNELKVGAVLYRIGLMIAAQAQQDPDFFLTVVRADALREPPAGMRPAPGYRHHGV